MTMTEERITLTLREWSLVHHAMGLLREELDRELEQGMLTFFVHPDKVTETKQATHLIEAKLSNITEQQ